MQCGLPYNPEVAKQSVEKLWAELNDLKAVVDAGLDADKAHQAVLRYRQLPTFGVNWSLAGIADGDAQNIADHVRTKINEANAKLGSNVIPLQRAFGAH